MALEILLPQLGLTMTEGTITEWVKKPGDPVAKGDVLFYVENDKAVIPYEASQSGVLGRILVEPMRTVPVGTVVALLETSGAQEAMVSPQAATVPPAADKAAVPPPPMEPRAGHPPLSQEAAAPPAAPSPQIATQPQKEQQEKVTQQTEPSPQVAAQSQSSEFVLASPYARTLAQQAGLQLKDLKGSGPYGAVVAADLAAAAQKQAPSPAVEEGQIIQLGRPRQVAAERLATSWHEIPQFTLSREVEAQGLLDTIEACREEGIKVSMTALIARLTAQALMEYPMLNSSWLGEGKVRVHPHVHLSIAVDSPDGLMVPVLRNCERTRLPDLAAELASLAEKARNRTLMPEAMQGGTFTISNLGMFGITRFRAIINPPQCAILAVGSIVRKPVEQPSTAGSSISFAPFLELSISADHRIVDGAYAARFLQRLASLLRAPVLAL